MVESPQLVKTLDGLLLGTSLPGNSTSVAGTVVYPQVPAVEDLALQILPSSLCTGRVNEVGVSESSGVTSLAVDSNSDIENVLDVAEEIVKILVSHLVGHVANEKSL